MIITIDSNVARVPVEVAKLLPQHRIVSTAWCTDQCVCNDHVDGSSSDRVLYDTPIAMCPDTDVMFVDPTAADNTVSFVYLDARIKNRSYGRIMNNLPRFKSTVVVSANAHDVPKGTYTVVFEKNNCGTDMVVKFMALLVNAFVHRKQILHPDSLLDFARRVPNPREICIERNATPVRCDLYSFSKHNCPGAHQSDCDLIVADAQIDR